MHIFFINYSLMHNLFLVHKTENIMETWFLIVWSEPFNRLTYAFITYILFWRWEYFVLFSQVKNLFNRAILVRETKYIWIRMWWHTIQTWKINVDEKKREKSKYSMFLDLLCRLSFFFYTKFFLFKTKIKFSHGTHVIILLIYFVVVVVVVDYNDDDDGNNDKY